MNRLLAKIDSINDMMWLINVEEPGTPQQLQCLNKLMALVKDDVFIASTLLIAMFTHMEYLDEIFLLMLGSEEFSRYRSLGELLMKLEENEDFDSVASVVGLWRDTRTFPWVKLESYDDARVVFHSELTMHHFAFTRLGRRKLFQINPLNELFNGSLASLSSIQPQVTYPETGIEVPTPKIYSIYFRNKKGPNLNVTRIG